MIDGRSRIGRESRLRCLVTPWLSMCKTAADPTTLDLRGLRCPLPALRVRKALMRAASGATLVALSDDPLASVDVPNVVRETGDELISTTREGAGWRFVVRRSANRPQPA